MIEFLLFLALSLPLFAQDVRTERHNDAVDAFKNLQFFYKGIGMAISPDLIKLYGTISRVGIATGNLGPIYQRWGLIFEDNEAKGIFSVTYEGMQVGVLGCVAWN